MTSPRSLEPEAPTLGRRPALAVAATAALVVVVGLAALLANLRLLGTTSAGSAKVGKLDTATVSQLVSAGPSGANGPSATSTAVTTTGGDDHGGSTELKSGAHDADHDADD